MGRVAIRAITVCVTGMIMAVAFLVPGHVMEILARFSRKVIRNFNSFR